MIKTALRQCAMRFFIGYGSRNATATSDFMGSMGCSEVKNTGLLDFASGLSYNFIYSENGKVLLLSLERVGCRKPERSTFPGQGNTDSIVIGFHSWIFIQSEGTFDANSELFKENVDDTMYKNPYEI